jgi:tRNA-dihydrouridine synthase 4
VTFLSCSQTIDLCRQLEAAGCSYLTIHARTKYERHEPIHLDELKLAADCVKQMPVVANGDLFSLEDCKRMVSETKVRGVMCARGLLENPALFAGHQVTPLECIRQWVDICMEYGTPFAYFHAMLSQMMQHVLIKSERRHFNSLISTSSVLDFLNENIFVEE